MKGMEERQNKGPVFIIIAGLETYISITGVASLAFLRDMKRHLPERVGFMIGWLGCLVFDPQRWLVVGQLLGIIVG